MIRTSRSVTDRSGRFAYDEDGMTVEDPLQRIEALAGTPVGTELTRAILDWFETEAAHTQPKPNLAPLAVDVALRLWGEGHPKDAHALADGVAEWLLLRGSTIELSSRMRARAQALAELCRLAATVPPNVLAALARIVAIDDWGPYDRELAQLDAETHDEVMDAITAEAPLFAGLKRKPDRRREPSVLPQAKPAGYRRPPSRRPPPPAARLVPPPAMEVSTPIRVFRPFSLFFRLLRLFVR
jgi:hypothetical protein